MSRRRFPLLPVMSGLAVAWAIALLLVWSDSGVGVVAFLVACCGAAYFYGDGEHLRERSVARDVDA